MGFFDRLKLPETSSLTDLNAPETTLLHRSILQKKSFLKALYIDFYRTFEAAVPDLDRKFCVELGSGGGFIQELFPSIRTSDVLKLPGLDYCFSALEMPFEDRAVDAFFMVDVFHHLPEVRRFLSEADRCLKPGGKIVVIEPANTPGGRFIYQRFHHEPFDPNAGWELSSGGPLSSANGALPWIVFVRDLEVFKRDFPNFRLDRVVYHTPLRYLISGGFTLRQMLPGSAYGAVKGLEWLTAFLNPLVGLFMTVELTKQ